MLLNLAGARGRANLLAADSFARLHAPPREAAANHALGWMVVERDWAGGAALTDAGSNLRWFGVVWLAPERDFGVVVACNQGGSRAEKAVDVAAAAMIRRFLTPDHDGATVLESQRMRFLVAIGAISEPPPRRIASNFLLDVTSARTAE